MASGIDDVRAKSLIQEYRDAGDPTCLDELVIGLAPLLNSIVSRFSYARESREDLLQVAYLGLLNAVSRYRDDGEAKFTTYASSIVDGEIRNYLRDKALMREPRWVKVMNRKINDAIEHLTAELGRLPNISEISDELNITEEGIMECLKIHQAVQVVSLDDTLRDEEAGAIHPDRIKSKRLESFHMPIEDRISVEKALESLSELQRKVIYLLFYLDLTQTEVAKRLGLNQRKVSRVRKQAVSNLRQSLSETEDEA